MNIAIYCGSSFGNSELYTQHAKSIIAFLKTQSSSIVYGGSKSGLMGIFSNEAIDSGLEVFGVITHDLANKEIENERVSKLFKVDTIRQRKEKMEELADAFIAYPGGFGTLEEMSEVFAYIQVGYMNKPCALYNLDGYYDHLIAFLYTCVDKGFIKKAHVDAIIISDDIEYIYNSFKEYKPPKNKWEL